MEKRISYSQFQSVKSVAKACDPLIKKRDLAKAKLDAITEEYNSYDTQIASLEAGIKSIIGFRVEELVKKVIESGVDANGQPKKTTKYLPTDIVSYDETKKQYVITIPDEETKEETSSDVETGSEEENTKAPAEQAKAEDNAPVEDTPSKDEPSKAEESQEDMSSTMPRWD